MKIQESFLPPFPFFHLLLHWVRQPFLGIPPFISDPGSLCVMSCVGLIRVTGMLYRIYYISVRFYEYIICIYVRIDIYIHTVYYFCMHIHTIHTYI